MSPDCHLSALDKIVSVWWVADESGGVHCATDVGH
jgi:hypothetical protein